MTFIFFQGNITRLEPGLENRWADVFILTNKITLCTKKNGVITFFVYNLLVWIFFNAYGWILTKFSKTTKKNYHSKYSISISTPQQRHRDIDQPQFCCQPKTIHRSTSNQHERTQSVLASSVVWPGQTTPPTGFEATLHSVLCDCTI